MIQAIVIVAQANQDNKNNGKYCQGLQSAPLITDNVIKSKTANVDVQKRLLVVLNCWQIVTNRSTTCSK